MKWASGILCLILLAASPALAKSKAQLAIKGNAGTVRNATKQVLKEAGYTVSAEEPGRIVFTKELSETGGSGRLYYALSSSSSSSLCTAVPPRLNLTVSFREAGQGTLVAISAMVESMQPIEVVVDNPTWMYIPKFYPSTITKCEDVSEPPIFFMRTGTMLKGLLVDIKSEATTQPRESVTHTVSTEK